MEGRRFEPPTCLVKDICLDQLSYVQVVDTTSFLRCYRVNLHMITLPNFVMQFNHIRIEN